MGPVLRLLFAALLMLMTGTAFADTKLFPERRLLCLACHGENGVSSTPEVPSLGGMPEFYALLQLVEFRDGNRRSEIMRGMVEDMTDDDLRAGADRILLGPYRPAPEHHRAADPRALDQQLEHPADLLR